MITFYEVLGSGAIISLVGLCVKLARNGNHKESYVKKEECHYAMQRLEDKLSELREDTTEIRQDVKILLKNGNREKD